jgi:hypothetical protein
MTVPLPSGEVVWDSNGEWAVRVDNYGGWASYGNYPQIWNITQKGSSFVAVRMIDEIWNRKGRKQYEVNSIKAVLRRLE